MIRVSWFNKTTKVYSYGDWHDLKKKDNFIQWINNENKKDFNVIYWLETNTNDEKKNYVEEDIEIGEYISVLNS